MKALENQDGLPIILLHGGLGKGKSTLARYICYHYGKNGEGRTLFEDVIFVSCGNCSLSNLPTKQLGILVRFSPTSLGDASADEKIDSKIRIAKAFEDYLSRKKKLIILDNLEDEDFLYHMWKASGSNKNVKYLVTSRKGNLCLSLTTYSTRIRMEDPNKDESRKIFASLIGLKNKEDVPEIPSELQAIADEMIDKTEGNPLALACLASNFAFRQDRTPKERKRAWLEALENYCNLLKSGEAKTVLGYEDYDEDEESRKERKKRSLWAAMKGCLGSLDSKDATTILFLMYSCKGESVPEEVIRTFYGHLKTSGTSGDTFSKSIDELRMRELLKRSTGTLALRHTGAEADRLYPSEEIKFDGDPLESTSWSLRPLVKLYMQQYMAGSKELKATIDLLIDAMTSKSSGDLSKKRQSETEVLASEKATSVTALCALYFDRGHQDPSVFLKYVSERQLDQDSILHLLSLDKFPSATLVTLGAMVSMFYIEEVPLLKDKNLSFLEAVLRLADLREGVQNCIQREASLTLYLLSLNKGIKHKLASTTGVLDVLVRSLQATYHPHFNWVARNAAATLGNLAVDYCKREDICLSSQLITNKDGAIASLVKSLSMHHCTPLRTAAAFALGALMWRKDRTIKDKIVIEDGAIPGLVECLLNNEESDLQESAATAFWKLVSGSYDSLHLKIANEDGVIRGLVHCLSNDKNPGGQHEAARALGNLACGENHSYIVTKIISEDGALTGLKCCCEKDDNPKLQEAAIYALREFLQGDDSIKSTIVRVDGLLLGLVRLLLESDDKPDVQKEVVWAFQNLLNGKDDSLKLRIANEDGVIRGLLNCLSNKVVQWSAAEAIINLGRAPDVKAILRQTDGVLQVLSSLLADDVPADTQDLGARALTFIDPAVGKQATLHTGRAYTGRAYAYVYMAMFVEALADFDKALDLQEPVLWQRCFVKAKLEDFTGALDDANKSVKNERTAFSLQERGVLKRMMEDLEGSLEDLDEGLKLETDDYELLKHRGYVKFLLKDEEGARADAEWALRIKPSRVDVDDYENDLCMGTTPVEYLGYILK